MWGRLKNWLGLGSEEPGPYFVIHDRYQIESPFDQYDPRRPFKILAFLESRRLLRRGTLRRPRPATIQQLKLVHEESYLRSLEVDGALEPVLGLDLDTKSQDKFLCFQRLMCGGTLRAARLATKRKTVAVNLGGGFHHATRDQGSGFCLFNDVAIAVAALREKGFDKPILIIDLDLHDGDGTRAIFADDPSVYTFSIHNQTLGDSEAIASTCIELGTDVGDELYLQTLRDHLPAVMVQHAPGLVFYLAGSDPCDGDKLGDWKISLGGMLERDRFVMKMVHPELGLQLPCTIVLAGGYGRNAWRQGAAFYHWLLTGEALLDIPLEFELPVGHYRRLNRLMKNPLLLPDETLPGAAEHEDWGLSEEELGMPGSRTSSQFLGTFSRYAVEYALVEYGLMDRLHQMGFKELQVAIDLSDPLGHTLRVQTGEGDPLVVFELKLRIDRHSQRPLGLLSVEWLLIQDSRSRFEMSRPLLPGQKYPGLGLLRDTAAVLVILCERLELDGLIFTPSHFHLAVLARPLAVCPDPVQEGRFQTLKTSVRGLDLRQGCLAVEGGQVLDEREGRPLVWEPAPLIIPVSDKLKNSFLAPEFRRQVDAAAAAASYRLLDESGQ